jgi:hypothetical protein
MMRKRLVCISFALLFVLASAAAQLPRTQVYSFRIRQEAGLLVLDRPQYLSSMNAAGYNNQVHFINQDSFFMVSNASDTTQTDIWLGSFSDQTWTRITGDGIPEYSPEYVGDNSSLYAVRVVAASPAIQELHRRSWPEPDTFRAVLPLSSVGYFLVKSPDSVVVFTVGDPNQLWLYFPGTDRAPEFLCNDPGRCLRTGRDGKLYYVHKLSPDRWFLKTYNWSFVDGIIATMPTGVEDFAIDPDGRVFCAQGSKMWILAPEEDSLQPWKEIADLKPYGLNNIQRLAISPDGNQLIVVNYE